MVLFYKRKIRLLKINFSMFIPTQQLHF